MTSRSDSPPDCLSAGLRSAHAPTTMEVATIQRFPARPESVGAARRFVAGLIGGCTGPPTLDAAQLLTSELVTNALLHGGLEPDDELVVSVAVSDAAVRVEALDRSRAQPTRRRPGVTDRSGRGVAIIAELARSWGTTPDEHGKWVWFELAI